MSGVFWLGGVCKFKLIQHLHLDGIVDGKDNEVVLIPGGEHEVVGAGSNDGRNIYTGGTVIGGVKIQNVTVWREVDTIGRTKADYFGGVGGNIFRASIPLNGVFLIGNKCGGTGVADTGNAEWETCGDAGGEEAAIGGD